MKILESNSFAQLQSKPDMDFIRQQLAADTSPDQVFNYVFI